MQPATSETAWQLKQKLFFLPQNFVLPKLAMSASSSDSFIIHKRQQSVQPAQFWKPTLLTAVKPFTIDCCKSGSDAYSI